MIPREIPKEIRQIELRPNRIVTNSKRVVAPGIWFTLFLAIFTFQAGAEDFTNALHAYLQHTVNAAGPNGCMVVGIVDESGSRVVSYGKLDNGTDHEASGDALFAIHSATGTFTRMLLMDMVERGEMQLDDPASKYLPESVKLPTYKGKEITLRHLAKEISGLPDFIDALDSKRADNPFADFTVEKMDAFISGCQLTAAPGTRHFHGGVDMGLLGQAMASKVGTDYEALMATRVFQPLNMASTRFTLTPELRVRLASEHDDSGFGYAIPSYEWGILKPVAGLYSSANDLLKFASASLGLMPSSLTPLLKKGAADFAYVPQPRAPGIIHTGGGGFAGGSYIGLDRARRRGVVILNTSCGVRRDLGRFLLQSAWESGGRPMATNINNQTLDSYVGRYKRSAKSEHSEPLIAIYGEADRLFVQAAASGSSLVDELSKPPAADENVELLPAVAGELMSQSETCFFERLSGMPINFTRTRQGKVTGLTAEYQGRRFSYEKISNQSPPYPKPTRTPVVLKLAPKVLGDYAGQYEFPPSIAIPTGMKLAIRREGDQLVAQGFAWEGKVLKGDFDLCFGSETNFFDKFMYAQYTTVKNYKGEVTSIIWHHAGQPDCVGRKLQDF